MRAAEERSAADSWEGARYLQHHVRITTALVISRCGAISSPRNTWIYDVTTAARTCVGLVSRLAEAAPASTSAPTSSLLNMAATTLRGIHNR